MTFQWYSSNYIAKRQKADGKNKPTAKWSELFAALMWIGAMMEPTTLGESQCWRWELL